MKKIKNIVVLPHTHWDREWYFTSSKSLVYSLKDFDEILDYLEDNSEIESFILDGQTSIIEDYLQMRPENTDRMKALVTKKRIMTGPWYTQPDTLVISGESLIRNLLYGTRSAKKLGHSMAMGYLPDSFGMSAQMPMIYNGFGIKYATFRRGIADGITKDREFYWKSKDGSKVFTHNIFHYGSMAYPPSENKGIEEYFSKMIKTLGPSSTTGTMILFNGEDQKPIRKNIVDILDKSKKIFEDINFQIENIEDTMEKMAKTDTNFITYEGEFTLGQHSRVHKSIFSTRADLKNKNNAIENFMVNILEPVSSLAYFFGYKYEEKLFEKIWKLMLDNSAHDSIGMCNSDRTNQDIKQRFVLAENYADALLEFKLREIGINIVEDGIFQFQIYNLLPYLRDDVLLVELFVPDYNFDILTNEGVQVKHELLEITDVTSKIMPKSLREVGVDDDLNPIWIRTVSKIYKAKVLLSVKDLSPVGYNTFQIISKNNGNIIGSDELISQSKADVEVGEIENKFYKIYLNKDNEICVYDKIKSKEFNKLIGIEDSGDEGDSYDYSEPTDDRKVRKHVVSSSTFTPSALMGIAEFAIDIMLPYNLEKRTKHEDSVSQRVALKISLKENDKNIYIELATVNNVTEHRLRIIFNTDINAQESVADQQFGLIERPVYLPQVENWKEEGWNEKPRTIEPLQSFVCIRDKDQGVQIVTPSVREYQIVGENYNEVAMTVYRATPFLGKDNLNDRPGRESGTKARTPDAELLGVNINSTYILRLYDECPKDHILSQNAKEILTPTICYQAAQFKNNTDYFVLNVAKERKLPQNFSMIEFNKDIVLSTIKKGEGREEIMIRAYNPSMSEKKKLQSDFKDSSKFEEVNLDETKLKDTSFDFEPCQVKSYIYRR